LALTVIVIGTVMVVLDTTIVNVALPAIGQSLHATSGIEWVVTAYLLAVAASLPATGWLADRFGRRAVFVGSLAIFTAASLGCAVSPNFGTLVAFRTLQGFGGGAIPAVGMAIVFETFPKHQHGRAISTWGMAALLSPAFGPTLGGWLVSSFSWHWLFLINLPIGVVALVVAPRLLPDLPGRQRRPLDLIGLVGGATGLSLIVVALSNSNQWGWISRPTILAGVCGLVLTMLFVRRNLRRANPLLELALLRDRTFSTAVLVTFTLQGVNYARLVFVPLELEGLRGYSPFKVGLLLAPAAVCTAVAMKIGGRMVDRSGPRLPAIVGTAVMTAGTLCLALVNAGTPSWLVALYLCLQGGFGLASAGVAVAAMSDLPSEKLAQASALRNLVNQVAGAVCVSALGAVLSATSASRHAPSQRGFTAVFTVAVGLGAVAVLLAFRIDGGEHPIRGELPPDAVILMVE